MSDAEPRSKVASSHKNTKDFIAHFSDSNIDNVIPPTPQEVENTANGLGFLTKKEIKKKAEIEGTIKGLKAG